nr:hypothetical protein [Nanoarchaeum sp.]
MKKMIYSLIVLLFVIVGGFFVFKDKPKDFGERPDFDLDNQTKAEITYFFEVTPDLTEVEVYCENNRNYCAFYCMEVNRTHEVCNNLRREPPK